MQKELLLAISDDHAASFNLRFLKEVFTNFHELKLTLFYVAPRLATWQMNENGLTPKGDALEELMAHKKGRGEKALAEAVRWIKDIAGSDGGNIETKVVHSKKGTVMELVEEAREGLYDALLLGRKGFTWFEEVFANSVSHELLWQDIDFPIWICKRPPARPRHDVLLCMDGSPASLRMVDHAGYMLAEEEKHTFTLFHVTEQQFDASSSARIFDEGLAALADNNVSEDRIELKMVTAKSQVKAILKEANEGNYSAVGVGRNSHDNRTKIENMFPSSVCINLLRQLDTAALWISK